MIATPEPIRSEIAYVIFVDIVGYSLMSQEDQVGVSDNLKLVIRIACSLPEGKDVPLIIDTGDGAAIVFFGGPSTAIDCAVTLGTRIARAGIEVRMGVHCGPLSRVKDVNGRDSVSGPAINVAERVMRCADAGQLLLSSAAATNARLDNRWAGSLQDLGEHTVKHGLTLGLHNLVTPECGRTGLPARLAQATSVSSVRSRKTNFTIPERPFVGRQNELEDLIQRVESGQDRFITITGPGGIGKSRLALEASREVAPNFADGAWLVACDVLATREDLIAQIASVLGLEVAGQPLDSLLVGLADRQVLLVIDCFERMTAHGQVLDELMKHCPELQLLVTSRVLVGLPREREVVLGSMSLRGHGSAAPDAVTLFVDAARAAMPTFRIDRRTRQFAERIVHAVEGVPLAIVLAAGRLRHLSLAELSDQIEKRPLSILKRKAVGDDRHADLTRVVDDSFALLSDTLKSLLVSLSVFRGGFRLADAEAVLEGTPSLLDGVSELRDNSLLMAQIDGDKMRYRSLDVIAEYIEAIADPEKLLPVRKRHASHFAHWAGELRALFDQGRWKEANSVLTSDLGNFRRATDFAIQAKDAPVVELLATSLCRLLMEAGFRSDFEKLALASQKLCDPETPLPLLIETTGLQGGVLRRDRDFVGAERLWLARAGYCRQAQDTEKEADTWLDLADMALIHGDPAKADIYLDRFAELEDALDEGLILASGFVARAKAAVRKGDSDLARTLAERAHGLSESMPHRMHAFYVWMSLADVFNSLGDYDLSVKLCRDGIQETIEGHHFAYTGLLLLKLATALEGLDRQLESAQALAIAMRVPKSMSQTLREQIRGARQGFIERNGAAIFRGAEGLVHNKDWLSEAKNLTEQLALN